MSKNNIVLTCKSVLYYSLNDEEVFFEWLDKIKSIKKIDGVRDELYLHFDNKKISNEDIRELLGLFQRYKIDKKQLKVFINETNKDWRKWKTLKIS